MFRFAILLVGVLSAAAVAFGDEPARTTDSAYRAEIPAHREWVEREVEVPPVTRECRVPRYENVRVPVYQAKRVPITRDVEVPTYDTREVPVYRTERVPVWGTKEVPVYRKEREPLTISIWNPFCCRREAIELWDRCVDVEVGTESVQAVVDHEERQVQCGTRLERIQTGTRTDTVVVGYRTEQEKVGERDERRLVGYDTQVIVVKAAEIRTVRDCVAVPAKTVTVVPEGEARSAPLDGTTEVVSEAEYLEQTADLR